PSFPVLPCQRTLGAKKRRGQIGFLSNYKGAKGEGQGERPKGRGRSGRLILRIENRPQRAQAKSRSRKAGFRDGQMLKQLRRSADSVAAGRFHPRPERTR